MEQIHSRPMAGRTVLVTGGTTGIGKATALGLAMMGAHLAITGRDRGRTEDAAAELRAAGGGQVAVFVADLSSQSEVRRLADEVLQSLSRIDVLVNNVGGYWNTRHVTADGLERTFALNHLASFLLTNLLLDRLKRSASARVVTVSSNAQAMGPPSRPPTGTCCPKRPRPAASTSCPCSPAPPSGPGNGPARI
jgi:retinol dehydrogenase-14